MNKNLTDRLRTLISRILPKGSAAHSISLIAGGTAMAQLLGILTMPVFSRIYSPADFGVLALFSSITAILVEISGLRYYLAIPLPKKDCFAQSLIILSVVTEFLFIALLTLALFFAKDFLLELVSAKLLKPYWFLIPLGVGGMGLYLILTQWAVREAEFSLIAKTKVTQSISGILVKLLFGLLGIKPLGLLLGAIASQAGGITTLAKRLFSKNGFPKTNKQRIKRVAIKYKKFPLYSTWGSLFNSLGNQIPTLALLAFYGPETVGLYALSRQVLSLPFRFIGQAIGQVFFSKASIAVHDNQLNKVCEKFFCALFSYGFLPIVLIALLAPDIFPIFFGEKWLSSGVYSLILAPSIFATFMYSPLSLIFIVLNIEDFGLFFYVSILPLRFGALWLGKIVFGSSFYSVLFYSLTEFLFRMTVLFWLLRKAGSAVGSLTIHMLSENRANFLLCILFAIFTASTQSSQLKIFAGAVFFVFFIILKVIRKRDC